MPIRVNGELLDDPEIAEEQRSMLPRLKEAMPGEPYSAVLAKAKEWARENVMERALLRQAAIADPEPVSEADFEAAVALLGSGYHPATCVQQDSAAPAMMEAEVCFRIERLKTRLTAKLLPPKSKEIGEYYKKNTAQFHAPEMVRAAHIVRNIDERTDEAAARASIEEIARKIESGSDFAQVANESSDCPGQGGDLGFFARGAMVPEFEREVFSLSPGQVSQPFRTHFGYHIAILIERRPPRVVPFEEVRQQIAEMLYAAKRQRVYDRYLDQLRAKAVVEIT
ncbi:MAG TPA: peptidylprolyl isomerase [Bryobacteraceae bacterium]|nr:peptidylprolyl isomerase [Bryobacteraceae bacterium]